MQENIRTLIFDLGGVIVDLDVSRTLEAFSALSGLSFDEVLALYSSNPAFNAFEKGTIGAPEFRDEVRTLFHSGNVADATLDSAWNAMLVGLPRRKLDLLKTLTGSFKVMILSNTNAIHVDCLHDKIIPAVINESSFQPFVDNVYYSYQLNMRKPDADIYEHVLTDNRLHAEETFFMDDNVENIATAKSLGIATQLIHHPDEVYKIFGTYERR